MIDGILLLGPTGVGKTPLGQYLERHGLEGKACVHFDFGEQLRCVAARGAGSWSDVDRTFIQSVLNDGVLLERSHFHIAEKILNEFMRNKGSIHNGWVVFNGLPRHCEQAEDLSDIVEMKEVIALGCTPEVAQSRILENSGGDRTGRVDDTIERVRRKLAIYDQRTCPLIEFYRTKGVRIHDIAVRVDSHPLEIVNLMTNGSTTGL